MLAYIRNDISEQPAGKLEFNKEIALYATVKI